MQHLLKDDTQVYKQFVENDSFWRFVWAQDQCQSPSAASWRVFSSHFTPCKSFNTRARSPAPASPVQVRDPTLGLSRCGAACPGLN